MKHAALFSALATAALLTGCSTVEFSPSQMAADNALFTQQGFRIKTSHSGKPTTLADNNPNIRHYIVEQTNPSQTFKPAYWEGTVQQNAKGVWQASEHAMRANHYRYE